MPLAAIVAADYTDIPAVEEEGVPEFKSQEELDAYLKKLEGEMREAAKRFEFEKAAKLRNTIKELRSRRRHSPIPDPVTTVRDTIAPYGEMAPRRMDRSRSSRRRRTVLDLLGPSKR